MGINVEISIKPKDISEQDIKQLNKEIYHRFNVGKDSQWWSFTRDDCNECWNLNSFMRYYGVGYERGDWPVISALVRYVIKAVGDGGDVYYFGDSHGGINGLEPTTLASLDEIDDHWVKVGHKPYLVLEDKRPCPDCNEPMWRSGWAGEKGEMYSCCMCEYSDWDKERTGNE